MAFSSPAARCGRNARGDAHLVQAARQTEAADELIEHVAGVLARLSHRGGDQRLPAGISDLFQRITSGSITQEV